ncbi:hypothetical protein FGO68_gene3553 [Halteria grandinella]|uniref:Uncharacterized protein n=1 Tax=Halteria grandinella TaxID=5974 RepID=A0A8J8NCT6_HALGN|nr:hypothetical protein FGO68_gene3553 [Halteria grandinella]
MGDREVCSRIVSILYKVAQLHTTKRIAYSSVRFSWFCACLISSYASISSSLDSSSSSICAIYQTASINKSSTSLNASNVLIRILERCYCQFASKNALLATESPKVCAIR